MAFDSSSLFVMYSDLLVYRIIKQYFHDRRAVGRVAPVVSSLWTSRVSFREEIQRPARAPTSRVPSLVLLHIQLNLRPVIVMNMQAVNFFVSRSQSKESEAGDKACELIGSLVAAGQNGGG